MTSIGLQIEKLIEEGELEQACKKFLELPCEINENAEIQHYQQMLAECSAEGGSERVRRLLEHMWENPGLEPDLACFQEAIRSCLHVDDTSSASELLQEVQSWGLSRAAPATTRFQLTPWIKWDQDVRRAGCSARNSLEWDGKGPAPKAPGPCWLIPSQDDMAVVFASRSSELLETGWKVYENDPELVRILRNKAELYKHAVKLGLQQFMPQMFDSASNALFPCVLKAAIGTWGSDMCIARSAEDVEIFMGKSRAPRDMLLQELVQGRLEYSTTLLVIHGKIFDYVCTLYQYDREEYIWPDANELGHYHRSVPEEHLTTMTKFLPGYTGIINFNYKVRPNGQMCIFETNPRVGADFAFDVPRVRVRQLLEKLDALLG